MLSIENIGVEIGGNPLFLGATYQFNPGEKVALVGRNGAGKSTLLRVIVGDMSPSEGKVNKSGDLKIAFFNQDLTSFETEAPINEVVKQAFAPVLQLGDEIEALLQRLEAGHTDDQTLNDLAEKQSLFDAKGGNLIDAEVGSMLTGLGFAGSEQGRPYNTFSGGWRMRVLLAKMLLEEPDVLLLDEPTNHLDLPSIEWLEGYLRTFRGATIIVSHDRFFLDRMADKILEISLKRLNIYSGNYAFYKQEKKVRHELQQQAYENQQKYIAQQERFITRFKAKASKATQAQSKLKQLDKLERIEAPEEESFGLSIRFAFGRPSGKEVVVLEKAGKSYGDKLVLEDATATILRGDKIALIGANGIGKSTLLRLIGGREEHTGAVKAGHNVNQAFFAQHQLESLQPNLSVLAQIADGVSDKTEVYLRTILGCFMFSGEDVEKPIRVLSGGERSRVALAQTLLSEANFLLLDEPTNHLDIASIQVLIEALNQYEGSYVVVSHDRWFLDKVANKIWFIENGELREYPGTYAEYAEWKARKEAEARAANSATPASKAKAPVKKEVEAPKKQVNFQDARKAKNRLKKIGGEIEAAETEIETLEQKQDNLHLEMAKPEVASDFGKLSEIQKEVKSLDEAIIAATERWENLSIEQEELEAMMG
ncbi:MAG: ABC-F family ATP-binding cassette domain-containing protein [Bacteroidia bacterium]